jgi:hypothetical protein
MIQTSVLQSFKHNIRQVSTAVITMARGKKNFQKEIKPFLALLDDYAVVEDALKSLRKYMNIIERGR